MRALLLLFALTAGCSTSSSSSSGSMPSDAGPTDSGANAPDSTCGHPGDQGNALGVGKYCEKVSDCSSSSQAKLCSIVGDPTTHFCTTLCQLDASVAAQCGGDDMLCECGTGGCGCTPKICVHDAGP